MKAIWFAALLAVLPADQALAWGQEGHAIVAEIAQRRLSPQATAEVSRLLGRGHSLASVASWPDDVRDARPGTSRWHFVDIPLASDRYIPAEHCAPLPQGDCAIAELDRLKSALRCGRGANTRIEALKFAVHLVGDLHQPLHTVDEQRGGNAIPVQVHLRGLVCSQACKAPLASNFHLAWDSDLIHAAVWDWGAYVDRLESGWLKGREARTRQAAGGTPVDWALETHKAARTVWNLLPPNRVLDDDYFQKVLPTIDRQLGLAGLRLARFLNEAYGSKACPTRY
ncbi:MAG TPA: S1/P1 nuclease [Xanthobacteraceae bacterium]|jgi:hypothetical protein|nr:S1/P1 nuclease [Xanthobacteraceae bacterium]